MTIHEIGEKYNITPDTLRYYEKIGIIDPVPRVGGKRDYGEKEIDRIEFVVCMRSAGIPIDVLIKYMELIKQGEHTAEQRKNLLIEQRDVLKKKLDEMNKAYDRLNYKIDVYYTKMLKHEKKLK